MTAENPYAQPRARHVRLSLSMSTGLIEWVQAEAKLYGVPVSRVVAVAIERRRAIELQEQTAGAKALGVKLPEDK